jgi:acetyl-CoA carboxylase biotin carboxylase subunit
MGDKASAKATMIEAGARCSWFSWYSGVIRTSARVGTIFGYPVMLKAGGGGKGMRAVWKDEDLLKAWDGARQESAAALGMMECILKN